MCTKFRSTFNTKGAQFKWHFSAMIPRVTLKRLSVVVVGIYLLFSCYGAYVLLSQRSSDTSGARNGKKAQDSIILSLVNLGTTQQHLHEPAKESNRSKTQDVILAKNTYSDAKEEHAVEIWSRAGVGQYTWEHILGATLEPREEADSQNTWSYGYKKEGNIVLTFRTGHGVLPSTVPRNTENLLLVLNGRAPDRFDFARAWLDSLDAFPRLRNAALMLIGSEQCQNSWVLPYMKSQGGRLRFLLVVYDTLLVDGSEILQWPLGVATYRGFPVVNVTKLNPRASRRYRCNFMASIYPNSSRETLLDVIKKHNLADYCYVKTRESWIAAEQKETRLEYERILAQSDLTLSPVGMNTECYRIYEAASYGSVPVVEDMTTPGECASEPLRLLKQYNAPFIFLKDWRQLPQILLEESKKSPREISQRREELLKCWIAAEQKETGLEYERILAQSDLTLSPVGMNTECYRIYEAASYGSVPVVEDMTTPGECASEPLRLLKQYNAPFIFLKGWRQLPQILLEESKKSPREISQRREELLKWYGLFRVKLKRVFLDTIQKSFFP